MYAARARQSVLQELLSRRDEFEYSREEERSLPMRVFEYANLFYGRSVDLSSIISIGTGGETGNLQVTVCSWSKSSVDYQQTFLYKVDDELDGAVIWESDELEVLKIEFQGRELMLPRTSAKMRSSIIRRRYAYDERRWAPAIKCVLLGPELLNSDEVIKYWENVSLTDDEEFCLESLRLITGEKNYVEGVATIGDRGRTRRVVAKLKGDTQRVPLASLGDGAMRMFGLALSLTNSRGGFLLIDEAENGIHHSMHEDYWHMVLETALKGNIQVVATTHSWDCVEGFAQAAARSDAEGVFVRLDQEEGRIGVVEYSEEGLGIVTKRGIEVR